MSKVTVIGAGVSGLTTAITLGRAGHDVSIVARDYLRGTTSWVAAAIWHLFRVGIDERVERWSVSTLDRLLDLTADPEEQYELDRSKFPIAARYTASLLGQFLGAKDRRTWLMGGQGAGTKLERENAAIDDTLREQLKGLGYAGEQPTPDTH